MNINVVLIEPEIPQNTGNIVRTCAAVGAKLHLIEPLGFSIEDKYLKRAGLDYWDYVDIKKYSSLNDLKLQKEGKSFYYSSTKSIKNYSQITYPNEVYIVFGKETAGIPEEILKENKDFCIRIPMRSGIRSLNLSNSVAIILFEILRQNSFKDLEAIGNLTKYYW